ncbi:DMT family transporter [Inquilinus limosus]|uniref:DMT family transporter n=1 Tax=Inquilinus limosus TaxID=171674 RepID=UPI0003F895FC|nr:DMT family transporter [Inquilinus limosus]
MTSLAIGADRIGVGIACAVAGFACFSAGDAVSKWLIGSRGLSAFELFFFFGLFALPVAAGHAVRAGGWDRLRPRLPGPTLLRSALITAAAISAAWAFGRLPMADVYALLFAAPILVTALSVPFLGETVGRHRWAAVVVGFAGILVMLRPGLAALDAGHAAALASPVFFSVSLIVSRRIGRRETDAAQLATLFLAMVCGGGAVLPFVWVTPDAAALLGLAAGGVLSAAGHILLIRALQWAPPSAVTPFQYSQMIWGVLYGLVLFGDTVDAVTMAGAAVVIGSGLYILWRETRRRSGVVLDLG